MAAIKTAGGRAVYDWQWRNNRRFKRGKPRAPSWLVETFGADYFGTVVAVFTPGASEDELSHVGRLDHVGVLCIESFEKANVTDAWLVHLKGLTSLYPVMSAWSHYVLNPSYLPAAFVW